MDLVRKYRPATFELVVGQTGVVSSLRKIASSGFLCGSFLFFGQSGCGKTTMARLIAMALNCESLREDGNPCGNCMSCLAVKQGNHSDVLEVNAAKTRGIDDIRKIDEQLAFSPIFGKYKVLILDEAHALTKDAQNSMLKILEDVPKKVCIILCSTEPHKIIATVRNRCSSFEFKLVKDALLLDLLNFVCASESIVLKNSLLNKIVSVAGGKPRNALLKLQQVVSSDGSESTIEDLLGYSFEMPAEVISLCRVLNSSDKVWADVVKAYKDVKDFDIELLSAIIAGYFRTMLERASSFSHSQKICSVLDLFVSSLPLVKPENKLVLNLYKAYLILRRGGKNG